MNKAHATQGATMMIVVLLTLFLLSAVLAVSLRLGVNSRQTVADQAATLQAQYRAESGLAVSRSRLQDLQSLLSDQNIELPSTVYVTDLHRMAKQFCGKENVSDISAWVNAPEFQKVRHANDQRIYQGAQECLYSGTAGPKQFEILAKAIKTQAYTLLPMTERPISNHQMALQNWWANKINAKVVDSNKEYISELQVNGTRAVRLASGIYRFYFSVELLNSKSTINGSSRFLKANRSQKGEWWIEIKNPNLLENVMVTNHHRQRSHRLRSPNIYFTRQIFEGSIHTNEYFLFSSMSKAQFKDFVTSAGCTNLPDIGEPSAGNCIRDPRVYINGMAYQGNQPGSNDPNAVLNLKVPADVQTAPQKPIDFTSSYKSLPTTTDVQKQQSQNGGLYMSSYPGILLMAGDINEQPLSTYDSNQKAWNEPSNTYQYISFYTDQTARSFGDARASVDQNQRYRFDQNNNLEKWDIALNKWKTTGSKFNGTIYSPQKINIMTPARLNNDQTGQLENIPPALASFANMTLAAEMGINIHSDMTMSNTPCNFSEVQSGQCQKDLAKVENMLGLYSKSGDILLTTNTLNNLNIHAALMASSGEISAENYARRPIQGDVNLIGSAVMNYYGAFGTFRGNDISVSGYGRNFSHDQRLLDRTPRGMPTSPSWEIQDAQQVGRALDEFIWKQSSKGGL